MVYSGSMVGRRPVHFVEKSSEFTMGQSVPEYVLKYPIIFCVFLLINAYGCTYLILFLEIILDLVDLNFER